MLELLKKIANFADHNINDISLNYFTDDGEHVISYEVLGNSELLSYCILPISFISHSYETNQQTIELFHNNLPSGFVVFSSSINYALTIDNVPLSSLSIHQLICLAYDLHCQGKTEYEVSEFINTGFVLLNTTALSISDYKSKYMKSSPLWGEFTHEKITALQKNSPKKEIYLFEKNINLTEQTQCLIEYLHATTAFQRFLKLYHFVELSFDYDIIIKIRNIASITDVQSFAPIMSSYSSNELKRLQNIMYENFYANIGVFDFTQISTLLTKYKVQYEKIFYTYGKDSNPVKDLSEFQDYISKNFNITKKNKDIIKEKLDLISYWIYRVRCSIAHNKIGEYIMSNDDVEFVSEFAEPLILIIIKNMKY